MYQFSSVAQSCPTLWDPMNLSMPGLPVHHQLPQSTQPMSIESVMPSNHLILCHPLLLLPSIFHSIRVCSNESTLRMRWPKYCSFSFNICPSNEYSGLISFRMDWLDLLAVQGTLKSLLQYHSSKHQFFGAQPSSQSNPLPQGHQYSLFQFSQSAPALLLAVSWFILTYLKPH